MFKSIWNWLTSRFKDLAKLLEKPADVTVQVVNVIKDYIDNPIVDIFTQMTRTGIDDKVVAILRQELPGVLDKLLRGEGIIKDVAAGNFNYLLLTFRDYLLGISKEARGKWWAELAAVLLPLIAGRQVEKPLSWTITQGVYLKPA